SGGVVTHSPRLLDGLRLNILGTLDINSGGFIDLNEKGLRGGNNNSAFSSSGETFDSLGNIVSGASGSYQTGAGASFAGIGANTTQVGITNLPYGLLEDALYLGSGGGGGGRGGNGGGRATITAGNCIIDGTFRVNGGRGSSYSGNDVGGGGSGGSIYLNVGTLSGSGLIQAVGGGSGGVPNGTGGAGGGGRIAIYYDNISFHENNIYVYGGSSGNPASSGTIYLKDNAQANGDILIHNNDVISSLYTPLKTVLTTFRKMTVKHYGKLNPTQSDITSFVIEQPVLVDNNSNFRLGIGVSMDILNSTGFDLNVENGSTVTLDVGSVLNIDRLRISNNSNFDSNIDLNFSNSTDLELSGNSYYNNLNTAILSLGVLDGSNIQSGTLNITENSVVNVATNSVTIDSGVTIIKDGSFGTYDVLDYLRIEFG
ncbi:MAG: hypothetical protein GY808_01820, partial [Gammaproteobacteria bacterium]|nr:hypothetical protein [Gammaproteobacteria bacterium]